MASNPLADALTPQLRKILYALVFVAGLAFGVWQATEGHPRAFIPAFIAALSAALAHGNVDTPPISTDFSAQVAQANAHLATLLTQNQHLDRRLQAIQGSVEKSPRDTGKSVAEGITKAAAAGKRKK